MDTSKIEEVVHHSQIILFSVFVKSHYFLLHSIFKDSIGCPLPILQGRILNAFHPGAKSLLFAGSFGSDALLDAFNGSLEFHPAIGEPLKGGTKKCIRGTLIRWGDNPDGSIRKQVIDM